MRKSLSRLADAMQNDFIDPRVGATINGVRFEPIIDVRDVGTRRLMIAAEFSLDPTYLRRKGRFEGTERPAFDLIQKAGAP